MVLNLFDIISWISQPPFRSATLARRVSQGILSQEEAEICR